MKIGQARVSTIAPVQRCFLLEPGGWPRSAKSSSAVPEAQPAGRGQVCKGPRQRRSMFTSRRSSGCRQPVLKPVFCSVAPQTPITKLASYRSSPLHSDVLQLCSRADPELRYRVQLQLNRGEARHELVGRCLFFANRGEFRSGDAEEIMNKASSHSLLSNAVLVNPLVIAAQPISLALGFMSRTESGILFWTPIAAGGMLRQHKTTGLRVKSESSVF